MIHTYSWNKETWVDIDHGTPEEIRDITSKYDIDPYVSKEIGSPTPKSRIEFHKDYVYLILHFPAFKHTHGDSAKQEIDFIIGKNFLVTVRYDTIDALHKISKQLEVEDILSKHPSAQNGYHIFSLISRELYNSVHEELEYIESWIDHITDDMFEEKEREMVLEISEALRTLLDFKKTLDTHKELLEFLREGGAHIFGKTFGEDIESLLLEYHRIKETIHSHIEMLRDLRETNNALLNTKQNEIIKTLTVFIFITVPATMISSLFAMDVAGTPFTENPLGFYIVLGGICVTILTMYLFARYKRWI
jgi:magnesium transporter